MENKILTIIKKNWQNGLLLSVILWLMLWSGYNTSMGILFSPGFSHNLINFFHGIRAFFPIIAGIFAVILLFKKRFLPDRFFLSPMGLLLLYAIFGIIASVFSNNLSESFYWGLMYVSVLIVLLLLYADQNPLKNLRLLINLNWLIAAAITFGLLVFFLLQPNVISSLTVNFLICSQRPYEALGGIVAAAPGFFGMVGTRPTGWGRYAGAVAIIAFAGFCFRKKNSKFIWFLIFIVFLGTLLFSKGRTEIIAFVMAMIFVIWIGKKLKIGYILGVLVVILLSFFIIFCNIPCTNSTSFITSPLSKIFAIKNNANSTFKPVPGVSVFSSSGSNPVSPPVTPNPVNHPAVELRTNITTLSGRATGVWPDAWHFFLSNPLFGHGFWADKLFLHNNAHNTFFHALIQAGLLGTVPFVMAFVFTLIILLRLFKNHRMGEKERNFLIAISAALVFFAVRSITESVAFYSADWLFVAPIIAYIQCLDSEMRKNNNSKNQVINFNDTKINIIKMPEVLEKINYWIKNEPQKMHWIVVTGMHGIVEAEKHADFKYTISHADMFVPDGISLVWLERLKGFDIKKRVSGTDLMQELLKISEEKNYKNYFYGDEEDTLKKISEKFPGIRANFYSPPFRELTEKEDGEIIKKINDAKPDILWVALGLPKQEKWIFEHREKLNVPVVIGVGAAFKFLSGKVKRAPKWVGNMGFEWLWRLFTEPKITWRRVFLDMPFFFFLVVKNLFF